MSYNAQDSPPITKNYPAQNVNSVEAEKFCFWKYSMTFEKNVNIKKKLK